MLAQELAAYSAASKEQQCLVQQLESLLAMMALTLVQPKDSKD